MTKLTVSDPQPVVAPPEVKLTCGALFTTTFCVTVSVQVPLVATRITVNVFADVYIYDGLVAEEVPVPSPKFHVYPVAPVEEFVKLIGSPRQTLVALKFAVGAGFTVM